MSKGSTGEKLPGERATYEVRPVTGTLSFQGRKRPAEDRKDLVEFCVRVLFEYSLAARLVRCLLHQPMNILRARSQSCFREASVVLEAHQIILMIEEGKIIPALGVVGGAFASPGEHTKTCGIVIIFGY